MRRISKNLLFASALLTTAMVGGQAFAQSAERDVEEVVVTGSRIKRVDISGVGPATVVNQEQIANTGITNVETLLQRLPASAGAAGGQTSAYWTGNGYGTAQVNLRGLGINRTLTLINGRRVVNGGTGANSAPDLNMIPTAIIGRMDILKDGASAIYGADAVAGVVNIITINGFEGLKVSGKYGVTDENDGEEYTLDLLWGMRGDRGGVTAALTYQKTEAVNLASRAPCALGESGGQLVCSYSGNTLGGRARLADGRSSLASTDPVELVSEVVDARPQGQPARLRAARIAAARIDRRVAGHAKRVSREQRARTGRQGHWQSASSRPKAR